MPSGKKRKTGMKPHIGQNKSFDLVLSLPNSFALALTPYLLLAGWLPAVQKWRWGGWEEF